MDHTQDKMQQNRIETAPKKAQMFDLLDKDLKLVVLNMFKELKNIFKVLKESMRMTSHQIGNINKEKEILKRT